MIPPIGKYAVCLSSYIILKQIGMLSVRLYIVYRQSQKLLHIREFLSAQLKQPTYQLLSRGQYIMLPFFIKRKICLYLY